MIETEGLSGADTLLRVLSHMGVDRIFASPGSEWSPVWEAFAKAKAQSEGVPLVHKLPARGNRRRHG